MANLAAAGAVSAPERLGAAPPVEFIERALAPGERVSAAIAEIAAAEGGLSGVKAGEIWLANREQRACDAVPESAAGGPSCSFCCDHLGVAALQKYPRQTCRHLEQHRCAVYERRPQSCAVYQCAWKAGNWPLAWRPDKVGCVVTFFEHPEEGHPIAVMTVDRARADPAALEGMLADLLAAVPEVKMIVDDRDVMVWRQGRLYAQGRIRRERGCYEDAVYEMRAVSE